MSDRPLSEHDILVCCALRFDGYKYQEEHPAFVPDQPIDDFLSTGQWVASEEELLAGFFFLQRALCKWSLVYEPMDGQYWQAFRSLFLQVNGLEIPEHYRKPEYCQQWDEQYRPQLEACVMLIQATYRDIAMRRGGG